MESYTVYMCTLNSCSPSQQMQENRKIQIKMNATSQVIRFIN